MRHVVPPTAQEAVAEHPKAKNAKAAAKTPEKAERKPQRGSTTLDEWLDNLMLAESRGRTTFEENHGLPYIIDTNGKRSYSCLQFQEGTFKAYSKMYNITGDITDCGTQKKLARAMIADKPGNYRHWLNSSKKIGLPPL
jgi:hypothetical protein